MIEITGIRIYYTKNGEMKDTLCDWIPKTERDWRWIKIFLERKE